SAVADCTARVVALVHTSQEGVETYISQIALLPRVAAEDAAHQLLDAYAPQADAAQLAFANEFYFPVSFR
ncbi:hypothetical protein ACOI1H_19235, partial [Loktanella sp. DJP18]|uniref:hypothetical protein n=1 Tax=Loktanella sp. DJP18 TaxID=3409788 RepID=UPI003BB7DDFF